MAGQSFGDGVDRVTRAIDRLNTKINLELTEAEADVVIEALAAAAVRTSNTNEASRLARIKRRIESQL